MRQDRGHFVQLQSALSLPIFVNHNQHMTSATYCQHQKKVEKQNYAFHAVFLCVALSMPDFGTQIKFALLKCPNELNASSSCSKHDEMFTFLKTEVIQTLYLKYNMIYIIYLAIKK